MTASEKKKILRAKYLKPKEKLRSMRLAHEYTTEYMASVIGLQRRQYEQKEAGKYPFNDYEMILLAEKFNTTVGDIFFED